MKHFVLALGLALAAPQAASADAAAQAANILPLIKAQWVGVREWEGEDLIYFTMLDTWRCGIESVEYGINSDAADQVWEQPECDPSNPNALPDGYLPYTNQPLKSIESVTVKITLKDGQEMMESYAREAITIP